MSWFSRLLEWLRGPQRERAPRKPPTPDPPPTTTAPTEPPGERTRGRPTSRNGASSFHLRWNVGGARRIVRVSAVLEVITAPTVDDLHFWALQASFIEPDGGTAHLGLQHNKRHPGRRAANWGGYAPKPPGGLLTGSDSPLPSTPNDPNTRDYPWRPRVRYRLAIERSDIVDDVGRTGWAGTVTDLSTGEASLVRHLFSTGRYLRRPVVWTECFAACDAATTVARWSELEAEVEDGEVIPISSIRVNYQKRQDGGCDNTTIDADGNGWVQRTNHFRATPQGQVLAHL